VEKKRTSNRGPIRGDCGLLDSFMKTPFARRRRALQDQLKKARLGALLVPNPASWYYLTGFSGEAGMLVVSLDGAAIITDGRFTAQARRETSGVQIAQQHGALAASVGEFLRRAGIGRIGFDASRVTVNDLKALGKAAGRRTRWIPTSGEVEDQR